MVTVKLNGTYWYGRPKRRYGPGAAVDVPEGLAAALGLVPIAVIRATPPAAAKRAGGRKPKASA